jgi:hypothetical protein
MMVEPLSVIRDTGANLRSILARENAERAAVYPTDRSGQFARRMLVREWAEGARSRNVQRTAKGELTGSLLSRATSQGVIREDRTSRSVPVWMSGG